MFEADNDLGFPEYEDVPCNKLQFSAVIIVPKVPGIFSLVESDVLSIRLEEINGLQVVTVYKNELSVGTVGSVFERKLHRCLSLGNAFSATVTSVANGYVEVFVQPEATT